MKSRPCWLLLALMPVTAGGDDRERIREALFAVAPPPALEAETHGSFAPEPGVVAERVTWATLHGLRVPAIVYRPRRIEGRAPGLVIVSGHGGDKYSWYAFYSGVLYARAGAVVVTYDPVGEGERHRDRRSGTRAHDAVHKPGELGRRLGGLMLTDVMQAVSYLAARPDVDPRRIGAAGYSMGSFVLSIAGAVDTRLRATMLAGGGNLDGPGEYWDSSKPMCQGLPYKALSFLGDRAARIYALRAEVGPTLIFNGTEDTIMQPERRDFKAHFGDLRRRAQRLAPPGAAVFENQYEDQVGHRPLFVTKRAALWLERQLDFPAWNAATIGAMEETHIGAWAASNHVDMDKLYATEHREGGTRALGKGIPALSRQAVSVFTRAEWEPRKAAFLYETWLERARGLLQH